MTKQWAEKEVVTLGKLRRSGTSYRTIGEILGRSTASCRQKAFHLGVAKPHRKEQPAQEQQRKRPMAKRKNTKWTKELDAELVSLRELGVKPRDVATIMKLPRSVIYSRSATLGVTKTSAQLEMDLQVAPATEPTKQVAPATKTEFRESPKTQIDQPKPKPTWWKQMMWWRK